MLTIPFVCFICFPSTRRFRLSTFWPFTSSLPWHLHKESFVSMKFKCSSEHMWENKRPNFCHSGSNLIQNFSHSQLQILPYLSDWLFNPLVRLIRPRPSYPPLPSQLGARPLPSVERGPQQQTEIYQVTSFLSAFRVTLPGLKFG